MVIHPQARTTPQIRAEIKAAKGAKQKALAEKYNVTRQLIDLVRSTINRRDTPHDR